VPVGRERIGYQIPGEDNIDFICESILRTNYYCHDSFTVISDLPSFMQYVCHAEVNAILNKNSADVRKCSVSKNLPLFHLNSFI
jgi:hypothetical protein